MESDAQLEHWDQYLSWTQFYMNNKIHDLFETSPFSLMYGRESNKFLDYSNTKVQLETEAKTVNRWEQMARIVYPAIRQKAKQRQQVIARQVDDRNIIRTFKTGQKVMILKPEQTVRGSVRNKLEPSYFGPMLITRINKRNGHYTGIEEQTGNLIVDMPPSRLKLFAEPTEIVDGRRLGKEEEFQVRLSDDSLVWISKDSLQWDMISTWREDKMKRKLEEDMKIRKMKNLREEYQAKLNALGKETEQDEDMEIILE